MGTATGHIGQQAAFVGYVMPREEIDAQLPDMDLSAVMERVWHGQGVGERREIDRVAHERVERQYREFWRFCKLNPGKRIRAPSAAVIRLWREHIADTQRYADDCEMYFGYFLHLDPNVHPEDITIPKPKKSAKAPG
ncbi:MAG: h16 [Parcubacteria group bacterium]|nr:h16 [Parcubacteria group bacterium]